MAARAPSRMLMTADVVGGVWGYALELARALEPYGIEVILATMGAFPDESQRLQVAGRRNVRLHTSAYRLEWMEEPWDDVRRAGEWLLSLEGRYQPDLIHLNGYAHGSLPWQAPCVVVGHSCVLSWWLAVKGEPAPPSWGRYADYVRQGLAAADLVVAPTRAMLCALESCYGPFERALVIRNGRSVADFPAGTKQQVILSAGRVWDEAKNIAAVDRVAGKLPWPVFVAGDSRHPEGGQLAAQHARPLGRLDAAAMADWLGRAAIYVLPARYEPFGLSVLEAALASCSLVLGDIPSLRELWTDAALFVSPDDDSGLEQGIRTLIEQPALRADLAARAQRRAAEFTAERMAEAYLSAYQGLLETVPCAALDRGLQPVSQHYMRRTQT